MPGFKPTAESDALFLSIGEGALVTDEAGRVSRMNQVALDILGFTWEDVDGKWYPGLVVAEDESGTVIPNMERPITEVFLSGQTIFKRLYYRRKDGHRVPVALTVSPIINKGQPVGAIEVFRDITKEVELENAKDEFISIASHQLRTPATVVKQYLGMMIDGYAGPMSEAQLRLLRTAYEYNDHQLDTISDLLKVAQADAHKIKITPKVTDAVALLRETIDAQRVDYSRKHMELVFEHNADHAAAELDELHIRMVLENLLDNANKYSPNGGKVTVTLHVTPKKLRLRVRDEGIGIAPQDLPKLFQKFSRIYNPQSSAGGTGLGLYWAKKLIELHGGSISASSELEKGTTFTLRLPRYKEAVDE